MAPTLQDYRAMVRVERCGWCGRRLPNVAWSYDHRDGWPVDGYRAPRWVYVRCGGCGYDWAAWRLGVPRPLRLEGP